MWLWHPYAINHKLLCHLLTFIPDISDVQQTNVYPYDYLFSPQFWIYFIFKPRHSIKNRRCEFEVSGHHMQFLAFDKVDIAFDQWKWAS